MPAEIRQAVIAHAENCLPDECCGLIAVDDRGCPVMAYPLSNISPSPSGFTMAPEEQFGAFRHASRRGWEIGGVFHSHPSGEAVPSAIDLAQPHDPDWFHLIVGFSPRLHLRAWHYQRTGPVEIELSPSASTAE